MYICYKYLFLISCQLQQFLRGDLRAGVLKAGDAQLGADFTYPGAIGKQLLEILLGKHIIFGDVLGRAEDIGKVGLVHAGQGGGTFAHHLAIPEDLQGSGSDL